MTTVHIYQEKDHIGSYVINGATYQDLITDIIRSGSESGQIYTLNGEEVDYNAPITEEEVFYIIKGGGMREVFTTMGFPPKSDSYKIRTEGIFRDLYNLLISDGIQYPKIIYRGSQVGLNEKFSDYNLEDRLTIVPSSTYYDYNPIKSFSIKIRTPIYGEIEVKYSQNEKIKNILDRLGIDVSDYRLAQIRKGDYAPFIYTNEAYAPKNTEKYRYYLVPDYETLFNGYASMLQ